MSDTNKEALSALMDGEVGELELHRVLKAVSDSEDAQVLRASWSRYHRVQDSMRADAAASSAATFANWDISAAVSHAIDEEIGAGQLEASERGANLTPQSQKKGVSQAPWFKPLASVAMAASVAAVVVLGFGQYGGGTSEPQQQFAQQIQPSAALGGRPVAYQTSGAAANSVSASYEQLRQQFQPYMQSHAENRQHTDAQSALSYARASALEEQASKPGSADDDSNMLAPVKAEQ